MKSETRDKLIDKALELLLGRDYIERFVAEEEPEEEADEEETTPKAKRGK